MVSGGNPPGPRNTPGQTAILDQAVQRFHVSSRVRPPWRRIDVSGATHLPDRVDETEIPLLPLPTAELAAPIRLHGHQSGVDPVPLQVDSSTGVTELGSTTAHADSRSPTPRAWL